MPLSLSRSLNGHLLSAHVPEDKKAKHFGKMPKTMKRLQVKERLLLGNQKKNSIDNVEKEEQVGQGVGKAKKIQ